MENKVDFSEYRKHILKVKEPRRSKETSTMVSKTIIRNIKKYYDISLQEDLYSKLIRYVNQLLSETLFEGSTIKFPYNMGFISLYKYKTGVIVNDGKLKRTMPIDWDKTLKAWYNNPKLKANKVLVRNLPGHIHRIQYTVPKGSYKHQTLYTFKPSRVLKNKLNKILQENKEVPAYEYGFYNNK